MSRMSSQESDYRYLEMHADQTLSVPIAQLRVDGQVLEATIELQAAARRLLLVAAEPPVAGCAGGDELPHPAE